MSYVDLHLHLLPGLDDGPRDLAAALRHARLLARDGVRAATVTPHVGHPWFEVDVHEIAARTRTLQAELDRQHIPLRLHPGGEIHPDAAAALGADELDAIAHGVAGARWVLAEVPFAGIDDAFLAGCAAIRARGFGVVIAHPERAAGFLDDGLARLVPEVAAGSVLQVNVCSLAGEQGPEAQAGARRLLHEDLAFVLASDGHGGNRALTQRDGFYAALEAGVTPEHARRLTQANPAVLLWYGLPARLQDAARAA